MPTDKQLYKREYFEGGLEDGSGYKYIGYQNFPAQLVVLDKILERNPESLLDIGGARGYITKMFEQRTGKPGYCLDISDYNYATRVTKNFILGDISDQQNPMNGVWESVDPKPIDLAFSIALFEHIKEEDLPLVIKRISNIAKRGLICPSFVDIGEPDHTHTTLRPKEWWVAKFNEHAPGWPVEIVDKEEMEKGNPNFQSTQIVNANGQTWTIAGKYVKEDVETLRGNNKNRAIVLNISSYVVMWRSSKDICVVNTDLPELTKQTHLDEFAAGWGYNFTTYKAPGKLPFANESVDAISCSHMVEHLTRDEATLFFKECLRVLKPDGRIRIAVPDAWMLCYQYTGTEERAYTSTIDKHAVYNENVAKAEDDIQALWHMLTSGGEHKTAYDSLSLQKKLIDAGFAGAEGDEFDKFSNTPLIAKVGWDMYPESSLYVEARKAPVKKPLGDHDVKVNLTEKDLKEAGLDDNQVKEFKEEVKKNELPKILEVTPKRVSWTAPPPPYIQAGAEPKKEINKICLISPPLIEVNPQKYGGLERVVSSLGQGLASKGYDVTIVAPEGSEVKGCMIFPIGKPTGMQVNWIEEEKRASLLYKDLIENGKFDIIHDHSLKPEMKIMISEKGRIRHLEIGKFVDDKLTNSTMDGKSEYQDIGHFGIFTPTFVGEKSVWRKVHQVSRHKVKEKLVKIKLMGGRTITTTKGHNLFVWNDGFEVIEAKDALGKNIIIPAKINFANDEMKYYQGLELNDDLIISLGLWLGDGSYDDGVNRRYNRYIHYDCCNDPQCAQVIKNVSSKYNNGTYSTIRNGLTGLLYQRQNANLMNWMQAVGFVGDSYTKAIPDWIYNISERQMGLLLRGLFSADAGFRKGSIGYVTASKNLADGVSLILDIIGIRHVRREYVSKNSFGGNNNKHYSIDISRSQYSKFSQKIGFCQNYKNERLISDAISLPQANKATHYCENGISKLRSIGDIYISRVESIEEEDYEGYVYDIGVEETEKFIADGILVHNTWFSRIYEFKQVNPKMKICHTHHGHLNPSWVQYVREITPTPNLIAISDWMKKLWLAQYQIFSKTCLSGDARILTVDGYITIKEIVEKNLGTPIIGLVNGRITEQYIIDYQKLKPYKSYMLRIFTNKGNTIKLTPDHKLLTNRGWINAENIYIGDSIYSYRYRYTHEESIQHGLFTSDRMGEGICGGSRGWRRTYYNNKGNETERANTNSNSRDRQFRSSSSEVYCRTINVLQPYRTNKPYYNEGENNSTAATYDQIQNCGVESNISTTSIGTVHISEKTTGSDSNRILPETDRERAAFSIHGSRKGVGAISKEIEFSVVSRIEQIENEDYVYDITTTCGNFVAENMVVHNCYNGIDTDVHYYDPTVEVKNRLLFVGRIDKLKRPDVALDIAEKAGLDIDIVGSVDWSANKEYAEGVLKRAANMGNIYKEATTDVKVKLMQQAKAVIVPSMFGEPFGLVVAESMACGAPVIALNDGGINEVIVENGGVVCDNPDEMVQAVKTLMDGDYLRSSREFNTKQKFSLDSLATRHIQLYEQIVRGFEW